MAHAAHPKDNCCDYEVEPPHYPFLHPQDEPRAVLVDTNLNTHLAVLISPLETFSALKQQIALEHFNCFPKFGRIMIRDLALNINQNHYLLPDTMLVKSAFAGVENFWTVSAEVWTPVGSMELPNHADVRHIKPSHQDFKPKHVEPPPQHHHEPKLLIPPQQNYDLMHVEPLPQYHHDPRHLHSSHQNYDPRHEPFFQPNHEPRHKMSFQKNYIRPSSRVHHKHPIKPSSQIEATPSTSEKKKRGKNNKKINNMDIDENTNVVSNTGSQDKKSVEEPFDEKTEKQGLETVSIAGTGAEHLNKPGEGHHDTSVMPKDNAPNTSVKKKKKKKKNKKTNDVLNIDEKTNVVSNVGSQDKGFVEEQLDEKTENQGQGDVPNVGKDTDAKHLSKPGEGHHDTLVMLMEDASDKIVTDLIGSSTNLAGNINKESENVNFESPPGTQATKSKKTKKVGNDGVTQNHPSTPVKGPAILEKGDAPSKNDTSILISEQIGIKTGGEASPAQWNNSPEPLSQHVPLNSENTSKKRKATESDQEIRKASEKILSQDEMKESRITAETEKEIVEDVAPVKLENTAKKRKTNKAKSTSTENQDLSSRRPNDNEKADGTKLSHPDDVDRQDESVETMSANVKKSRNRKVVPGTPVKEQPDAEIKEMATPIAVFESHKSKKKSQKKQPVPSEDPSNLVENQHLDETMMEEDVPVKVDDTSTKWDANDALFESEKTGKSKKPDDNDRDCGRTADDVSPSLLNDHSNVILSQDESSNLVEKEKEIKEDVVPSKSENTAKKRKSKAKSGGTENQKLSSRRQNEDEKTDDGHKVSGAKLATEMDDSEIADDVMIDSKSSDAYDQNAVKQGEEHANFSQNPGLESPAVVDEVLQLEKPLASKKTKKADQASSIDTSSNRHNLVGSKKSRGSAKTSEPQLSNTVLKQDKSTSKELMDSNKSKSSKASSTRAESEGRKIYQEEEAKKPLNNPEQDGMSLGRSSRLTSGEVLNTSKKKNGWSSSSGPIFEDGNSLKSSDEDGSNASSSSATVLPDDSDLSEVESRGTVKSKDGPSKGNGSIKAQSSGMKLESILKSSSRYKKAKLVASQSQGESELPEFVPESQGI